MNKKVVLIACLILIGAALIVFFFVPLNVTKLTEKGPPKLGSPDFTESLDSKVLPPLPPKFGGEIKDIYSQSKPWWPPTIVPPKGAPNVLLIMLDDAGYGSEGTFGGVIPTPPLTGSPRRGCVTPCFTQRRYAHRPERR